MLQGAVTCAVESRQRLLDLSIGFVEDLQRAGVPPGKGPEGYCSDFQVCFPYRGLFVWHVEGDDVVGDANQVVFSRPDESFRMAAPISEGYAELIVTPHVEVLGDIMNLGTRAMSEHPLFKRRSCRADSQLQYCRTRLLHSASRGHAMETLEAEECVLVLSDADLSMRNLKDSVTVGQDRLTKAAIYAAAGIPEYWIVNLREDLIEVHRGPARDTGRYTERVVAGAGDRLSVMAFPDVIVTVDDLLPHR